MPNKTVYFYLHTVIKHNFEKNKNKKFLVQACPSSGSFSNCKDLTGIQTTWPCAAKPWEDNGNVNTFFFLYLSFSGCDFMLALCLSAGCQNLLHVDRADGLEHSARSSL